MTGSIEQHAGPFVTVLGIAQDAGVPHPGCACPRCEAAWEDPAKGRRVTSLAVVDPGRAVAWVFDATPDFPAQLRHVEKSLLSERRCTLGGIFLTHAHMGHYTGLMHLGREGMGARHVAVFCLPRLEAFLRSNGPWEQLVALGNVVLETLSPDVPVVLGGGIRVTPWIVPHRDEYSETAGFAIEAEGRMALFIPDIDGWDAWSATGRDIEQVLEGVDVAYLDGTFFDDRELPRARRGTIPHPTVSESLARFSNLPPGERGKVRFIHLNHSNPALEKNGPERAAIGKAGMAVAQEGEVFFFRGDGDAGRT